MFLEFKEKFQTYILIKYTLSIQKIKVASNMRGYVTRVSKTQED